MQNVVNDALQVGLPGQLFDIGGNDIIGRNNYSKQLEKVDITADDTTTTVTINGTGFTFTETGAAEDKEYIANYLTGEINAGSEPVTAYHETGWDYLLVESNTPGTSMTVVGTANCTVTQQIANAAAINFGLIVTQDQLDQEKARNPIVATDITDIKKILGITVHTQAIEQFYQSPGGAGYALNKEMSICKKSRVWVVVETAVTVITQPYARFTVAGSTVLGAIRGDDDSGKAAAIPTAKFYRGAAANGYAVLDINLP